MTKRTLALLLPIAWAVLGSTGLAAAQAPSEDCPMHDRTAAATEDATTPYAGLEARPVKALSRDQREQLLAGHGMGLALAAELNHFPGPKHVLELASKLNLTPEQVGEARRIFHEMQARAQELGRAIVDAETALDADFAAAKIDETGLAEAVGHIGRLQADLRVTHLRAHLRMRAALTEEQTKRYDELRGYAAPSG